MKQLLQLLVAALSIPSFIYAQTPIGQTMEGIVTEEAYGSALAVSADGRLMAVGAPSSDTIATDAGQVYTYYYDTATDTWNEAAPPVRGINDGDQTGYRVALSADGTRLAVSAPYADSLVSNGGRVRVYERTNSTWVLLGDPIDGNYAAELSGTGLALSADGNRVAIGAPGNDGGTVRVYDYDGVSWSQRGSDIRRKVGGFDAFGSSCALTGAGDYLAIGAPYQPNQSGLYTGTTSIYTLSNGDWVAHGNVIEGEASFETFGSSVALSDHGSYVLIGAPGNNEMGTAAGRIALYAYDTATDSYATGYRYAESSALHRLGTQVGLSKDGQVVAAAAPGAATNTGQVIVLQPQTDTLVPLVAAWSGTTTEERFGTGLAISSDGTSVAAGAPLTANGTVRAISTPYTALPVTWLALTGKPEPQGVRLSWQVFETDNYGYYVEHSKNGRAWHTLGFKAGAADRAASNQYQFFHAGAHPETNYYRILQQDLSGKASYSPIISVRSTTDASLLLYPNPVVTDLNVVYNSSERASVKIISPDGQIVRTQPLHGATLDLEDLPEGTYHLILSTEGADRVGTFYKQ